MLEKLIFGFGDNVLTGKLYGTTIIWFTFCELILLVLQLIFVPLKLESLCN